MGTHKLTPEQIKLAKEKYGFTEQELKDRISIEMFLIWESEEFKELEKMY